MRRYILRYSVALTSLWEIYLLKSEGTPDFVIQSPRINNWGIWGELESCPTETYVTVIRIKVQKFQGEK